MNTLSSTTHKALCVALVLLICLTAVAANETKEQRWFEKALLGLEVGPTGPESGSRFAEKFNGQDIVRRAI